MAKIYEGIEGYAEMSAEEKISALEALEQVQADDTDAKKWKSQYDKTAHDLAENKKALKALQEQLDSRLTEEEKARVEAERISKARDEELESLKRQVAVNKTIAQYIGLGYSEELAQSTAEALYDGDVDTVIANNAKYKEEFEQVVRTNIVKGNPKPDVNGGTPPAKTKKDIMAIEDRAERQKAIAENIDLFK